MKAISCVTILFGFVILLPISASAAPCESLSTLALPGATITMAQSVAAGAFTPPGARGGAGQSTYATLPAFCRVAATLKPTADSDIKIEVWLPASGWNGKLESVGNGAWAGTIGYGALGQAVAAGYAGASTDTGHTGGAATFIVGHPERVTDFAYRAVHEMTVAAKSIIAAYYGNAPKRSYFNGCSTGGRQALAEAQRFPQDYDGIISGAAANYPTHLQGMQTWVAAQAHLTPESMIPASKYPLIQTAVMAACDASDGVKDGVLEDPRTCHFDPKVLQCKAGDEATCLTKSQVELAQKIYAGPTNRNGREAFPGLERGSETGWRTLAAAQPMGLAVETFEYLVFNDPKWDFTTFDFNRDVAKAEQVIGLLMNSIDPNLKPFFDHGGKLLMYHGWADPGIPPRNSVNYYNSVVDKMGKSKTADSIKLFMVPGMGHCQGGDGTDTFDKVGVLDQWVEKGKAPDQILASHRKNGVADKTRPLCPYPQVAKYKGAGSTDEAANFVCKAP
jgi:feruloyl esterase